MVRHLMDVQIPVCTHDNSKLEGGTMSDIAEIKKERLKRGQCPHCGTDLETGFGLAGGGYGVYMYCPSEQCGEYFDKTQMDE